MENNKKSNRVRINDSLPSGNGGNSKPRLRENDSVPGGGNGTTLENHVNKNWQPK